MSESRAHAVSCAFCYKQEAVNDTTFMRCGKCRKRSFCSKDCQRADWKAGHRRWCGVAGEINHDFEIRLSSGRGLGVFALRRFRKNEKVMAERPLMLQPYKAYVLNASEKLAFERLVPERGTFNEKCRLNQMDCRDIMGGREGDASLSQRSGIFIFMSLVNHECLGNTQHLFLVKYGVSMLFATREIDVGEEISMPYILHLRTREERQARVMGSFGFRCTCMACTSDDVNAKLEQAFEYDSSLTSLAQSPAAVGQALRRGQGLLGLWDELGAGDWVKSRTCYDIFQIAVLTKETAKKAAAFTRQAANLRAAVLGEDDDEVMRVKTFADNPSVHQNYGIYSP
jgi:hypothetical protein